MIPSEDQVKLEQFVKEVKELPHYKSEVLFKVFVQGDILSLIEILRDDDGIIDSSELKLLGWYLNVYLKKYQSDEDYGKEAVDLIYRDAKMAALGNK
jgi:hypothetical protein